MLNLLPFRRLMVFTGLVSALGLASCSDKEEAAPTGTVQGELNVAGATKAVTLTAADGKKVSVAPDPATGKFVFDKVVPGTYSLTALPADGYVSSEALPLTVKAGETAAAKLIFNRNYSMGGTMSWEQNGVRYTASHLSGLLSTASLTVVGTTEPLPGGGTLEVSLSLSTDGSDNVAPFQGTGTYPLGTGKIPYAYGFYYLGGNFDQYVTNYSNRQVGQVQVTRFAANEYIARGSVATGTFEFVAPLALNTTGKATAAMAITNGKFDVAY
jgi:hypothetical protein